MNRSYPPFFSLPHLLSLFLHQLHRCCGSVWTHKPRYGLPRDEWMFFLFTASCHSPHPSIGGSTHCICLDASPLMVGDRTGLLECLQLCKRKCGGKERYPWVILQPITLLSSTQIQGAWEQKCHRLWRMRTRQIVVWTSAVPQTLIIFYLEWQPQPISGQSWSEGLWNVAFLIEEPIRRQQKSLLDQVKDPSRPSFYLPQWLSSCLWEICIFFMRMSAFSSLYKMHQKATRNKW